MTQKEKLMAIGIRDRNELRKVVGNSCSQSLANKIWYGRAAISVKMARKIKKSRGTSLDYLLG